MNHKIMEIVEETRRITDCGSYEVDGKEIHLKEQLKIKEFENTKVYSPDELETLISKWKMNREKEEYIRGDRNLFLLEADALLAAKEFESPLVMNFANAKYPGGGFLKGSIAQEESICRASTLYASLNSKVAKEMYTYNRYKSPSPLFSDYMILSPDVAVFRDFEMNLIPDPFFISVLSVPAVDKRREAKKCSQEEIDEAMIHRLRCYFTVAADAGYRNLIVGAWGCGSFGNDPKKVASYFKEILLKEDFIEFFDYVIFAIIDTPKKKRLLAFKEVFGEEIEAFLTEDELGEDGLGFFQFDYPMPICNQDYSEIDLQENLGLAQGVFADGTPFQAELWVDLEHNSRNVTFVIPYKASLFADHSEEEIAQEEEDNIEYFHTTMEFVWNTMLCDGMEIVDDEVDFESTDKHVTYLMNMGIIAFQNDMINGIVHVLKDYADQLVVAVNICIETEGMPEARIGITFHPFVEQAMDKASRKARLKVIKNDENKTI